MHASCASSGARTVRASLSFVPLPGQWVRRGRFRERARAPRLTLSAHLHPTMVATVATRVVVRASAQKEQKQAQNVKPR